MLTKALRALRGSFWLVRVSKPVGTNEGCRECNTWGRYDPLYGGGVSPGQETGRTQDCPYCSGLGYHFIPEE